MEITQSEQRPSKHISRRDFLKLAGVSVAGGWLALRHWINENGPASLLSGFLLGDVKSEIPVEFLNEKEDPNPFFENPDRLLEKSFQLYNQLTKKDSSQYTTLSFIKRKNYISTQEVYRRYRALTPEDIAGSADKDLLGKPFVTALKSLSPTGFEDTDQSHGGDIFSFSAGGIDNIRILLATDPGSGFMNRAIRNNFQVGRDVFYANHPDKSFSEEETQKIQRSIVGDLVGALNYFRAEYTKNNRPLDLAEALTYFYTVNQGDIYSGLWDSVVFFKLFVRNDLNTLLPEATFKQSMLLGEMFKDSFSPRNSLNWLVREYRARGIDNTHSLAGAGFLESQQFKDFMVINRSGGIYHGLNILTWAAVCMDPLLVEAVTAAYYSGPKGIGMDFISEHGILKIESDLIVAMKSPEIRQVVDHYVKVE